MKATILVHYGDHRVHPRDRRPAFVSRSRYFDNLVSRVLAYNEYPMKDGAIRTSSTRPAFNPYVPKSQP